MTIPALRIVVLLAFAAPVATVVPTPTFPLESIKTLTLSPVRNSSESLSSPAVVSALMNVSPSTSFTPPSDPQAFPAPYPSNWDSDVLYLI